TMFPIEFGVKLTWMSQVEFTESVAGQSLVSEKSLLGSMLVIFRSIRPLDVSVTVCEAPAGGVGVGICDANVKVGGENEAFANFKTGQAGAALKTANARVSALYLTSIISDLPF